VILEAAASFYVYTTRSLQIFHPLPFSHFLWLSVSLLDIQKTFPPFDFCLFTQLAKKCLSEFQHVQLTHHILWNMSTPTRLLLLLLVWAWFTKCWATF